MVILTLMLMPMRPIQISFGTNPMIPKPTDQTHHRPQANRTNSPQLWRQSQQLKPTIANRHPTMMVEHALWNGATIHRGQEQGTSTYGYGYNDGYGNGNGIVLAPANAVQFGHVGFLSKANSPIPIPITNTCPQPMFIGSPL